MDRRQRWVLTIPVLVVAAYALFADTMWIGGWAATVDRVTGTTVLTGPLLASVAAGVQLGVVRLRPISDTTVRGWRVPYRSALDAWTIGTAAYTVTLAVAIGCTFAAPHGGPVQWWALAAGLLVLALSSMFGALAAHLLPSRVTVLAAGPALFLLGAFGPPPVPEVLRFGPGGDLTGLQFIPSVYLSRFAATAALCLCLAVAMAPWRQARRRLALSASAAVAVLSAVATAAAVLGIGAGTGDNRLEASDERATVCAQGAPTVCVAPSHRRYLERASRAIGDAAGVLGAAGVVLPDRYEEALPYQDPSEGSGEFYLPRHSGLSFRESVLLLTQPAPCPQWSGDAPPFAALDAAQLIAEWAAVRHGERAEAYNREMDAWLSHIDDPATTRWVVETFALLRSCRFDDIGFPWE